MRIQHNDISITRWSSIKRSGHSLTPVTGVKIIHLPTGIEVTEENHRSAHRNKAVAWKKLESLIAKIDIVKLRDKGRLKMKEGALLEIHNRLASDPRVGQTGKDIAVVAGAVRSLILAYLEETK